MALLQARTAGVLYWAVDIKEWRTRRLMEGRRRPWGCTWYGSGVLNGGLAVSAYVHIRTATRVVLCVCTWGLEHAART